jgi:hypothetical protein
LKHPFNGRLARGGVSSLLCAAFLVSGSFAASPKKAPRKASPKAATQPASPTAPLKPPESAEAKDTDNEEPVKTSASTASHPTLSTWEQWDDWLLHVPSHDFGWSIAGTLGTGNVNFKDFHDNQANQGGGGGFLLSPAFRAYYGWRSPSWIHASVLFSPEYARYQSSTDAVRVLIGPGVRLRCPAVPFLSPLFLHLELPFGYTAFSSQEGAPLMENGWSWGGRVSLGFHAEIYEKHVIAVRFGVDIQDYLNGRAGRRTTTFLGGVEYAYSLNEILADSKK